MLIVLAAAVALSVLPTMPATSGPSANSPVGPPGCDNSRVLTSLPPMLACWDAAGKPKFCYTSDYACQGVGAVTILTAPATPPYVAPDGRTEAELIATHVLPDAAHPGVVNPLVTGQTQARTICTHGWTATVRPPTSYTNKLRLAQTPAGFAPGDGELDHRLSIEDGGDPADAANLWWMIYADRYGARVKDVLETKLARRVCAGTLPLSEARAALLGNWLVAYEKYVGPLPK